MSVTTQLNSLVVAIGNYTAAVNNKLATKSNVGHTHSIAEIINLQTTLDAKETPAGAQTKADAAESAANAYTDAQLVNYALASSVYTKSEVDTRIQNVIDSAPSALDTLNELAAALGDDPNFATTITNQLALKADITYVDSQIATRETPTGAQAKADAAQTAAQGYADTQLETTLGELTMAWDNATTGLA